LTDAVAALAAAEGATAELRKQLKTTDEALAELEEADAEGRVLILTDNVKQAVRNIEEKQSAATFARDAAAAFLTESEDTSKSAEDRALATENYATSVETVNTLESEIAAA
jgi:hypothetical protein